MNSERSTDEWIDEVYHELRAISHRYLENERPFPTLQTTALVHEGYVRLSPKPSRRARVDFLAAASQLMREILIDYARARGWSGGAIRCGSRLMNCGWQSRCTTKSTCWPSMKLCAGWNGWTQGRP